MTHGRVRTAQRREVLEAHIGLRKVGQIARTRLRVGHCFGRSREVFFLKPRFEHTQPINAPVPLTLKIEQRGCVMTELIP